MAEIVRAAAGDFIGPVTRRGRRLHDYSTELGGGLYANVCDDRLVSIGIEPLGEVIVRRDGGAERLGHRTVPTVAWAAPLAGAAVAAVATGLVRRRRAA